MTNRALLAEREGGKAMKVRRALLGVMVALLVVSPVAAQSPFLSEVQAPYPAVPSTVHVAGGTYGPGVVSYGPAGTPLVLIGTDLGSGGTVTFIGYKNGAPVAGATAQASVSMWTSIMVFLTVPTGATSGVIQVTVEGKTSNTLPFIVMPGTYAGTCPASPPTNQLQILTSALEDGMVGQAYSATLSATGGTQAYTWSVASGTLPAGLALNASTGVISGTPTAATAPVYLTFRLTDHSAPAQSSSDELSLTINPSGTPATIYSYGITSYDGVGNVTGYTDTVNGTWSMAGGYDSLNRLTSAMPSAGVYLGLHATWSYDAFGNRSAENFGGSLSSPYAPPVPASTTEGFNTSNQVQAAGSGYPPSYDSAGDVTCDSYNNGACSGNQYLYDADGRVCAVKNLIGKMMEYLYDAEGTRVAKGTITGWTCDTSSNGFALTNSYVLSPGNQQLTELSWNNNTTSWAHTNVWAGGQLIATYSADPDQSQGAVGVLNFPLTDWLGTRRVLTDYAGDLEESCHSLPFGNGEDCSTLPTEHLFTGKERDSESGNDYFGARYYASSTGRWMSPDTGFNLKRILLNPQKWNRYSYVLNNPLALIDPDGLEEIYVFLSYMNDPQSQAAVSYLARNGLSPNWRKIQSDAVAHGNHVYLYSGKDATYEQFQAKLSKGQTTVQIGETVLDDVGHGMQAQVMKLGDGNLVGSLQAAMVWPYTMTVSANGGTVAVFGCSSMDLASAFPGAKNFFGIDSGRDRGLGSGLDSVETNQVDAILAGAAFVGSLAVQDNNQGSAAALSALSAANDVLSKKKDKVVQVPTH